jgi:hypothetical protein
MTARSLLNRGQQNDRGFVGLGVEITRGPLAKFAAALAVPSYHQENHHAR